MTRMSATKGEAFRDLRDFSRITLGGANGIVMLMGKPKAVRQVVELAVLSGSAFLVIHEIRPTQPGYYPVIDGPLTEVELRVVSRVAEGYTNKRAGIALHLSELTIKSHLARVAKKLGLWGVRNGNMRALIVAKCIREGWI